MLPPNGKAQPPPKGALPSNTAKSLRSRAPEAVGCSECWAASTSRQYARLSLPLLSCSGYSPANRFDNQLRLVKMDKVTAVHRNQAA